MSSQSYIYNPRADRLAVTVAGYELLKRRGKWGQPAGPLPPGTLPDAVPIAFPDRLAIV